MPERISKAQRSSIMRSVRSQGTAPELLVRSVLHRMGYRFRVNRKDMPGKPDIVLPKHRLIIFVHGCFWHRHANCKRALMPASNCEYWMRKFERNVKRDKDVQRKLRALGWNTVVVWTCQTTNEDTLRRDLQRRLTKLTSGNLNLT